MVSTSLLANGAFPICGDVLYKSGGSKYVLFRQTGSADNGISVIIDFLSIFVLMNGVKVTRIEMFFFF